MRTNMHSSPKPKVSCSLGRVSVSVTRIKNCAIKVKYCFISAASDARRGEWGGTYLARHLSHLGSRTPWHLAGPSVWYLSVSDSGQMAAWREITCADKRALADTYSLAYSCLAQIIHVSQMHCSATVLNTSIHMDTARVSCVLPVLQAFTLRTRRRSAG